MTNGTRNEGPIRLPDRALGTRVSNGTRTRDILDHNQVLYQLSYTHRDRRFSAPAKEECTGSPAVLAPPLPAWARRRAAGRPIGYRAAGGTCRAAILRAVSESGPGCGTKTASR